MKRRRTRTPQRRRVVIEGRLPHLTVAPPHPEPYTERVQPVEPLNHADRQAALEAGLSPVELRAVLRADVHDGRTLRSLLDAAIVRRERPLAEVRPVGASCEEAA